MSGIADDGLTKIFDKDDMAQDTCPGMASWGGVADNDRRCIDCKHWGDELKQRPQRRQRKSKDGEEVGSIPAGKRARCGKFRDLMGRVGATIPAETKVCRYDEPQPDDEG